MIIHTPDVCEPFSHVCQLVQKSFSIEDFISECLDRLHQDFSLAFNSLQVILLLSALVLNGSIQIDLLLVLLLQQWDITSGINVSIGS